MGEAEVQSMLRLAAGYVQSARPADAEHIYASILKARRDHCEALAGLGFLRYRQRRFEEAVKLFRKALYQRSNEADLHNGLGMALQALKRSDEAAASYKRAIALRANFPEAYNNLGNALQSLRREDEAVECYEKALSIKPNYADAHRNLAKALNYLGRSELAVEHCRAALAIAPDHVVAHTDLIFYLNLAASVTMQMQQQERSAWYDRHGKRFAPNPGRHNNTPDPDRLLRIGYVSAHFRSQAATFAYAPVILEHDRIRFEVFCYSDTRSEDDMTAAFKANSTWREIAGQNDDTVAAMIHADQIDILVDLVGHMGGNRLLVFARKPAPIQVTAWGEPTGTGLGTMDYLLADPVLVPHTQRGHLAEQVVDLPCFLGYWQPYPSGSPGPLPALANGYVTFGSFNRPYKISEAVLRTWSLLLGRIPDSHMVIKHGALEGSAQHNRILTVFNREGIASERISMLGPSDRSEHLLAYRMIDLALDPFPHSGGMTTLEALSMGVPVVTAPGETIASRLAASCLMALGLGGFIASTASDYVDLAAKKAADLPALAAVRESLPERLAKSPVGNSLEYRLAVEAAYRRMWDHWCNSRRA